jgi:hypothetical protein
LQFAFILLGEGVGQFLELLPLTAFQKSIGTLPKIDPLLPQAISQPVMLIETDSG